MRRFLILPLFAALASAQQNFPTYVASVNSAAPPAVAYQFVASYDSSGNPSLACWAKSKVALSTQSVTAATNAATVALTITGHGWYASSKPSVTFAGGTGAWAALNGTRTVTVVDANTVTVALDSTSWGAMAGTITAASQAPRLTAAVWAVQVYVYSGDNYVWSGFAAGSSDESAVCTTPAQIQ